MKTSEWLLYLAVGAAGGAVITTIGWAIFSRALNQQFQTAAGDFVAQGGVALQRTLDTEIPQRVRETMDQRLREAGFTADTGRQLAAVLEGADRIGLIGIRGIPMRGYR
jgi:hypothetical protein